MHKWLPQYISTFNSVPIKQDVGDETFTTAAKRIRSDEDTEMKCPL